MSSKKMHILDWPQSMILLFLIGLTVSSDLAAQSVYSDQDILLLAMQKHEANLQNLNDQTELTLPEKQWIDQMEFRTEFNELDINEQEYTLRLRFRNDKVRKIENELLTMKRSLLESESNINIDDGAEDVYKNMISLHFNQELDSLITYKLALLKDKNSVATTLLLSDQSVNFNDALKIKEREFEMQKALYELNWQTESILNNLGFSESTPRLNIINLINIERLTEVVQNAILLRDLHPDLSTYEARMNILEKERQLELEDTQTLLRFAQLRYKADNDFSLERELSLGLAFNLPYRNVNKLNLAKLELDQIEQNLEKQETLLDINTQTEQEINELSNLIKKFSYLTQLFEEENLDQLKTEYLNTERVEALPLINLELMLIDRQIELLKSQKDIYLQYISALDETGALEFSKNTNWLDQELRPIQ
jgi:hypothetical protein